MAQTDPIEALPPEIATGTDSFYELLDVSYNATTDEIKRAYREKVRKYHPDTCDKPYAEEMTFALNQAVDTLSSQGERMAYNELGHKTYHQQRTTVSQSQTQSSTDESSYESSIYELVQMAKVNTYTTDPWWQVILRSNGFKLTVGIMLSLSLLFGLLLVI